MYSNFSEGRGRLYTRYNLSNSLKNTQQPNVHVNVQPKSRNRGEIFYYFGLDRSIISWEGVQVFSFADHSSLATSRIGIASHWKFIKHRSIQCPVTLISGPVIIYRRWGATENFGRIQRGDHSNLFEKWRRWGGGEPESHQKLPGGITSVKQHSKGGSAKFHLV